MYSCRTRLGVRVTDTAAVPTNLAGPVFALVGNPNCGKTALYNLLTGSRQKIANYAGVTVERKEGRLKTQTGRLVRILDLPGAYSLRPRTPDESVTCDTVLRRLPGEVAPSAIVAVVDATNLRRHLRLVLALKRLGYPVVVALNMVDLARRRGLPIDGELLSRELQVPVIETVGIKAHGADTLIEYLENCATQDSSSSLSEHATHLSVSDSDAIAADYVEVERILAVCHLDVVPLGTVSDRIDRVVLHPMLGPLVLASILFLMFQAVYRFAKPFMGLITDAVGWLSVALGSLLPPGVLRSLLVDGVLAGTGSILVFLPQIIALFGCIILLEDSGYLPRAAFLLDRLMGAVGLSGRAFIPLLSSFACAIPGIMATRTIPGARERLVTIMIAPLMTCSARLPVYVLLIGAFIPDRSLSFGIGLQGVVLFGLYVGGVVAAFAVASVLKFFAKGQAVNPLQMELPTYHWPSMRNLLLGLLERVKIFVGRIGSVILALTIVLWFLSSFPVAPAGFVGPAIEYSYAGRLGLTLAHIFAPIGFNWQISLALVPGFAAREVAVGALGTVYSLAASGKDVAGQLSPIIAASWSLPTALSLLVWYVFAPQCLSTLATVRRETNSWRYPLLMAGYLFALAYVAAGITYRTALWFGTVS